MKKKKILFRNIYENKIQICDVHRPQDIAAFQTASSHYRYRDPWSVYITNYIINRNSVQKNRKI